MRKKIISGFLALAMVFTNVPTNVTALGTLSYNVIENTTSLTPGGSSSKDTGNDTNSGSGTNLKPNTQSTSNTDTDTDTDDDTDNSGSSNTTGSTVLGSSNNSNSSSNSNGSNNSNGSSDSNSSNNSNSSTNLGANPYVSTTPTTPSTSTFALDPEGSTDKVDGKITDGTNDIEDATITLADADGNYVKGTSDSVGAFEITCGLNSTDDTFYTATITKEGYLTAEYDYVYDSISSGWEWCEKGTTTQITGDLEITPIVKENLTGTIKDFDTNEAIEKVEVTITNPTTYIDAVETSDIGDFTIPNVDTTDADGIAIVYTVQFKLSDYATQTVFAEHDGSKWVFYSDLSCTNVLSNLTMQEGIRNGNVTGFLKDGNDIITGFTVIVTDEDKNQVTVSSIGTTNEFKILNGIDSGKKYTFEFFKSDKLIYQFTKEFSLNDSIFDGTDTWNLGVVDISTTTASSYEVIIKLGNQAGSTGSSLDYVGSVRPGVGISTNGGEQWEENLTSYTTLENKPASTTMFKIDTDSDGYLEYQNEGVSYFEDGALPVFSANDFRVYPSQSRQIGWTSSTDVYFCKSTGKVQTDATGGQVVYVKAGELIPLDAIFIDELNPGRIDGFYVTANTVLTAVWGDELYAFELTNNNFFFDKHSGVSFNFFNNGFVTTIRNVIFTASINYGQALGVYTSEDALIQYIDWTPVVTQYGKPSNVYASTSQDLTKIVVEVTGISEDSELELELTVNDVVYELISTDTATTTDGVTYTCTIPAPTTRTVGYITASKGYEVLSGGQIEIGADVESLLTQCIVKFQSIYSVTLDSNIFYPFENDEYVAKFESEEKLTLNFNDFKIEDTMVFESWKITKTSTGEDVTKDLLSGTNASTATFYMPNYNITISATYNDSDGYIVYFYEISGNNTSLTQSNLSVGDLVEEPTDPIRDGYTFTGWYIDSKWTTLWDFDTELTASHIDKDNKMVLYAGWEGNEVTIEINYNGSTNHCNNNGKVYQVGDQITIDAGEKSGALFSYWSWSSNNWDTTSSNIPSMENSDYCVSNAKVETSIIIPPVQDGKTLTIEANWDSLSAYLIVDKIVSPETNGNSCVVTLSNPIYGTVSGEYDDEYSEYGKERYYFDLQNMSTGLYNVDISSTSGQVMTGAFYITEDEHNYHSIELLPVNKIPTVTSTASVVSNVASNNMNEMFTAAELSSTDRVTIDLVVTDVSSSSLAAQQILSSIASSQTIGAFVDVTLQKNVEGVNFTMQPANAKGVNVILQLPDSMKGRNSYFVSTVHNGLYSQLSAASVSYDSDTNTISFYANNLSVFGIGFTGTGSTGTGIGTSIPTAEGYNMPIFQNVMVGQWIEGLGKYQLVHPDPDKYKFAGWYFGENGTPLTAEQLNSYFVVTEAILQYGIYPHFVQVDSDGNVVTTPVPDTGKDTQNNILTLTSLF